MRREHSNISTTALGFWTVDSKTNWIAFGRTEHLLSMLILGWHEAKAFAKDISKVTDLEATHGVYCPPCLLLMHQL